MNEKIEFGDTVTFTGDFEEFDFIVIDIDKNGFFVKNNIISFNPKYCKLVKKGNIDKDKKIENLRAIIAKNYKKIENQSKEITLLIQQKEELKNNIASWDVINEILDENKHIQDKLNIANNTIALQIEELNMYKRSFDNCMEEIERQKVIIEYLEGKIND